jgi:hypothetical protein
MAISRSLQSGQLVRLHFSLHHLAGAVQSGITSQADMILASPANSGLPEAVRRRIIGIFSRGQYVSSSLWNLLRGIDDPAVARLGLLSALGLFAKQQAEHVRLTLVPIGIARLPLRVEQALYDIGVEAIANAQRHAGPGRRSRAISVEAGLEAHPASYRFWVQNAGQRCDQKLLDAPNAVGVGLMRHIARDLQASFAIEARPEGGVRVEVVGHLEPADLTGGQHESDTTGS